MLRPLAQGPTESVAAPTCLEWFSLSLLNDQRGPVGVRVVTERIESCTALSGKHGGRKSGASRLPVLIGRSRPVT